MGTSSGAYEINHEYNLLICVLACENMNCVSQKSL